MNRVSSGCTAMAARVAAVERGNVITLYHYKTPLQSIATPSARTSVSDASLPSEQLGMWSRDGAAVAGRRRGDGAASSSSPSSAVSDTTPRPSIAADCAQSAAAPAASDADAATAAARMGARMRHGWPPGDAASDVEPPPGAGAPTPSRVTLAVVGERPRLGADGRGSNSGCGPRPLRRGMVRGEGSGEMRVSRQQRRHTKPHLSHHVASHHTTRANARMQWWLAVRATTTRDSLDPHTRLLLLTWRAARGSRPAANPLPQPMAEGGERRLRCGQEAQQQQQRQQTRQTATALGCAAVPAGGRQLRRSPRCGRHPRRRAPESRRVGSPASLSSRPRHRRARHGRRQQRHPVWSRHCRCRHHRARRDCQTRHYPQHGGSQPTSHLHQGCPRLHRLRLQRPLPRHRHHRHCHWHAQLCTPAALARRRRARA